MSQLSCVIVPLLAIAAAPAPAADLAALLAGATAAARPSATIVGTGTLVTTSPDGRSEARVLAAQNARGDLYLQVQPRGPRALLLADGTALLAAAPGATPAPFATEAQFAGSEFSREDLQPFDARRYGSPTIVDGSPSTTTVQLDPHQSQYSLVVVTFDRDRQVPLKVMSYKDTLSNLLRMRRESGHQQVGGRWVPAEISIENFPMKVTSTLTLRWSAAPSEPAGIFDPKTFATAALAVPGQ
jgi:hypothetical protein